MNNLLEASIQSHAGRLSLFCRKGKDGRYHWYDENSVDTETSANSLEEAKMAAMAAWPREWDLQASWLE